MYEKKIIGPPYQWYWYYYLHQCPVCGIVSNLKDILKPMYGHTLIKHMMPYAPYKLELTKPIKLEPYIMIYLFNTTFLSKMIFILLI